MESEAAGSGALPAATDGEPADPAAVDEEIAEAPAPVASAHADVAALLAAYDKDGDGVLSSEELMQVSFSLSGNGRSRRRFHPWLHCLKHGRFSRAFLSRSTADGPGHGGLSVIGRRRCVAAVARMDGPAGAAARQEGQRAAAGESKNAHGRETLVETRPVRRLSLWFRLSQARAFLPSPAAA